MPGHTGPHVGDLRQHRTAFTVEPLSALLHGLTVLINVHSARGCLNKLRRGSLPHSSLCDCYGRNLAYLVQLAIIGCITGLCTVAVLVNLLTDHLLSVRMLSLGLRGLIRNLHRTRKVI